MLCLHVPFCGALAHVGVFIGIHGHAIQALSHISKKVRGISSTLQKQIDHRHHCWYLSPSTSAETDLRVVRQVTPDLELGACYNRANWHT